MIDTPLNPDIFRERLRDLYARYHGFVRHACRRYVQNRDDADDLAQEVLMKAARGWEGFRGTSEASTWLYRVAANHCADHLRRRRRQRNLLILYAHHREQGEPPFPADNANELSSALADMLEKLRAALDGSDRRIAYLRFEAGLKHDHIARVTGLSRTGVTKRLIRIQKKAALLWQGG
jgi:RNA polymerase sigma factor (sigma-70 family)